MPNLLHWLIRRFRPRVGWPLLLLALAAALCPSLAAAESPLRLPASAMAWAGVIGVVLGMRGPRAGSAPAAPAGPQRPPRFGRYLLPAARYLLLIALWLAAGALLILGVIRALPPLGLLVQDIIALWDWAGQIARRGLAAGLPQASRVVAFLSESLPRSWRDLIAAPAAGERGARLLVTVGGMVCTWVGALALGWGLARRRSVIGWSIPLLAALTAIAILGGASVLSLAGGTALLLLLAMATDFRSREASWDRAGVDFSGELLQDVLMWGSAIALALVTLAALLPSWLENPLASQLWRDVETPSGLAVLERNIQRAQRGPPVVDPGISKLPALDLGISLEDSPPDAVALRVRLDSPLPSSPWPHYWRARIYNIYTGRGWTQNARVRPLEPLEPQAGAFPGAIVQEIEDNHADRGILLALPDTIAVSVPANTEQLPDGTQSALTPREPTGRYRVLSRPQELASAPPPDRPPPDMSGYLLLPQNIPPQIGETARAATQASANQYEQALALEQFLRELPYSYQVEPLPGDGDAVYQFLFQMRHGYCTYYASAMAVMARSLGIPARVASGFATGEYDPASATYTVREADAHAWPELYIDGRWVPFEPTPIRPLPARANTVEPTPAPQPAAPPQPANLSGPLIWLAVLLGLAALVLVGIWAARRPASAPLVAQVQLRLERGGARAGVPWPPGATLHEYGALLEPRLDGAGSALREAVELIELARYGRHELRADEERRLRAAESLILAQLKRTPRRS